MTHCMSHSAPSADLQNTENQKMLCFTKTRHKNRYCCCLVFFFREVGSLSTSTFIPVTKHYFILFECYKYKTNDGKMMNNSATVWEVWNKIVLGLLTSTKLQCLPFSSNMFQGLICATSRINFVRLSMQYAQKAI